MRHWKIIGAIVSVAFWLGCQLSGFISIPLAILLWTICVVLLVWSAWPLIQRKVLKPISLKKGGKKAVIIIGFAFIAMGLIGIVMVVSQLGFHRETPSVTTTQTPSVSIATNLPTFIDLSKVDPSQILTFSLGEGGFHCSYTLAELESEKKTAIYLAGATFDMYVTNGKFYVDTSIYGGEGSSPVEIRGNEFSVKPPNWDKNYDENALEVVNEQGKAVFQLIYKSQYHIVINGIFPIPNNGVVWANELGVLVNPSPFDVFRLDSIFKYPSSQYLGQRVGQ